MIKWKKGSEDLKWVMGRNKYRPPSDRKDGRWTVGQRFVSHRDRQRDRVKTDGQDTDRQRKRFKTAGHGTKTDRQRKEIQVEQKRGSGLWWSARLPRDPRWWWWSPRWLQLSGKLLENLLANGRRWNIVPLTLFDFRFEQRGSRVNHMSTYWDIFTSAPKTLSVYTFTPGGGIPLLLQKVFVLGKKSRLAKSRSVKLVSACSLRSTFESQICLGDSPTKYFLTFPIQRQNFWQCPQLMQTVPLTLWNW